MIQQPAPPPGQLLAVRTERTELPATEPLAAYHALGEHYGREQVFLLESAGGPDEDCRQHFLGFGELLTVSVTAGEVHVAGIAAVREAVLTQTAPVLRPGLSRSGRARLRADRTLWDLLRAVERTFRAASSAARFEFGFLAYFGYDVAHYIEDLPRRIEAGPDFPDLHLVLPTGLLRTEVGSPTTELLVYHSTAWPAPSIEHVAGLLDRGTQAVCPEPRPTTVGQVEDEISREDYLANVATCLTHIAAGDIYQVQIGHELSIPSDAEPVEVYRRLRQRNASPYMCLATIGANTVIGASPELFVRVEDGEVTMRPIAGTAPRGLVDDATAAQALASDPKEIAEHVMLIDLCRNDIGRICRPNTLEVRKQLAVERYSHVIHLVSTVVGQAAPGVDSYDIIAALFPAGTMTGAPKIRAMEIIENIERSRRGLYAGALGLVGLGGYLNLALCIRTLIHRDGVYRTRASAGLVADSDPAREWAETLAKSNAAYWAVTGGELL